VAAVRVNPRIALGGKKKPQFSFTISKKKFCPFVTFPEYEVGTKCNNQVANRPIGAPEVVWHDVKHV